MPTISTATYELSERQIDLFTDTVDIYVRTNPPQDGQWARTAEIESVPTYVNVPCKHIMTDELSRPDIMGITNQDNMDVIDHFRFNAAQEVQMGWILRLKTPGSPNEGLYWSCQGNPKVRPSVGERDSAAKKVFALRCPPPWGAQVLGP